MKKKYFLLSIITAFLVFIGVQAQSLSATKDISPSNMKNTNEEQSLSATKKVLVVYFSHSGNTREVANQIHEKVGGDILEIRPEEPYPRDYEAVKDRARQELKGNYRPKLKTKVANMEAYDVVFIGYPIWWGTMPMPIAAFLSEYDLSGKTIVPFCTHLGSGLGRSVTDIAKL
jgi:flavodoxin